MLGSVAAWLWLSKLLALVALGFTLALIGTALGAVLASRAVPLPALESVPLKSYTTDCGWFQTYSGTWIRDC